ncbi:hypothetical protein FXO37_28537 [Capsicum annuum]|nr:hypothetical protein FXO37_28537 [Capsicum annuum]
MNNNWPENFEMGFEEAIKFLSDPDSISTNIGPLLLFFKFFIMAHIIATTLILRKGSLSNITCCDDFVMYWLVKKIKINGSTWVHKYILKSTRKVNAFSSLPYRLLITWILLFYSIDLSGYPPVEVAATYDSGTFISMEYVLELEELKQRFKVAEKGIMQLQESTSKLLDLKKSMSSNISVVPLGLNGLKQEGVKLFSRVPSCMDSLKSQVSPLNDDMDVFV